MKCYYYTQEFDIDLDPGVGVEKLIDTIAQQLQKPKDTIIVCNEKNSYVTSENITDLSSDSPIVIYDAGRGLSSGMNKEGMCTNPKCTYFNRYVVENVGFPSSERVRHECTFCCPYCGAEIEVTSVIMKDCHYYFYTISGHSSPKATNVIHVSSLKPIIYDISTLSNTEEYDFDVQKQNEYVCTICNKLINEDMDCERVRRKSHCESCG